MSLDVQPQGEDWRRDVGEKFCVSIDASDYWTNSFMEADVGGTITVTNDTPLGTYTASLIFNATCS